MSEDRLEEALEAMRNESVSPEQLAGTRDRVRARLTNPSPIACAEFQPDYRNYLAGGLSANRRLLVEDHLGRCAQCRDEIARLKGERKVVVMPQRSAPGWTRWGAWAAAAALLIAALYVGRHRIDTMLAPGGPRASVASVSGSLYRVPDGLLQAGSALGQDEVVRTGPGARAVLRLADGSRVEVNERTELSVRAAWSGQTIRLERGDIIVEAAKQRRGQLRVQTRDSVASVQGTVFAVSFGIGGTVVSVIEGSVAVTQPGIDTLLRPGEQAASNPVLAHSVEEAVSWSSDAEDYLALLASFGTLEKEIARLPSPALRTQPRLLQYMPANAAIYGAIPNIGGTISQAVTLAEQQAAENPVFREWWNSAAGQEVKQIIDRIQTLTPLLGDEIVFMLATGASATGEKIPMVAAEVQPGKQSALTSAVEALRGEGNLPALPYSVTGSLLVASDSQEHLQWVLAHMGEGAATSFAEAIAARYQRGAGWLLGMDTELAFAAMPEATGEPAQSELLGARQMKHLFLEQRDVQGFEENEVTLTFKGPRMGMASWLASSGSGGAAEYISSDAVFSLYVSTREPRQLFDELTAQLAKTDPSSGGAFAEAESRVSPGFASDLASALGTESAFALEGLSATGPVWVIAALVNDPSTLDNSIRKLVDVFNAELPEDQQAKRIALEQETIDGRSWTTMKSGQFPLAVTWTYDRGYLVAASDRGVVLRAIANRGGGSALVWSPAFRQQLPSSAGLHPSGFVWLNTKGALEGFASLVSNPAIQKLIAERDPILVVFGGTTEQIQAASRTRISGLIVDMMLLESLARAGGGTQSAAFQQ